MITIQHLTVSVNGKLLIKDLSLDIKAGEIHAIMGPNGAGKSTLAKVLAGHPGYEVEAGNITFLGQDLIAMEPEERAYAGLFMGFQYPIEIGGVSNKQFLQAAYNLKQKTHGKPELSDKEFDTFMQEKMALMDIRAEFKERNVNEGFSGGEKKRNEILQMAVLNPSFAILDETDSGLDIDALKVVARGVNCLMNQERGLLLITHYQRLLDYIKPHYVHVMMEGTIVQSGGAELALELESKGYDWLIKTTEETPQ